MNRSFLSTLKIMVSEKNVIGWRQIVRLERIKLHQSFPFHRELDTKVVTFGKAIFFFKNYKGRKKGFWYSQDHWEACRD